LVHSPTELVEESGANAFALQVAFHPHGTEVPMGSGGIVTGPGRDPTHEPGDSANPEANEEIGDERQLLPPRHLATVRRHEGADSDETILIKGSEDRSLRPVLAKSGDKHRGEARLPLVGVETERSYVKRIVSHGTPEKRGGSVGFFRSQLANFHVKRHALAHPNQTIPDAVKASRLE
jgi:hypothetical protein